MRVAVLTISTLGARGERADTSGDTIGAWAAHGNRTLAARALVTDDTVAIARQLIAWADDDVADLILTTGGTGLSERDVTPEATRVAIEREAPGIAECLRRAPALLSSRSTTPASVGEQRPAHAGHPRAALSRGIAGVRNRTLIVNLPGSPAGVRESLAALDPIVEHAVAVLRGTVTEHGHAEA